MGLRRAVDEVNLLAAGKRRQRGGVDERQNSSFIAGLGDLLTKKTLPASKRYRRRAIQKGIFE